MIRYGRLNSLGLPVSFWLPVKAALVSYHTVHDCETAVNYLAIKCFCNTDTTFAKAEVIIR